MASDVPATGSFVLLTPRVVLHAVASPPALPPGWRALRVIPSDAFGDGSHPTTRLCARALDLLCRQRALESVLDVGTGTGVLARLAVVHGVPVVVGTDIDPRALAAAQANAALDERPFLVDSRAPDAWGPRFDVVVANITEQTLVMLADALVAALRPGGVLLISGFMPPQTPALRTLFAARGLEVQTQAVLEGWVLLAFSRPR